MRYDSRCYYWLYCATTGEAKYICIITGIDKPDANPERVERWLRLAGCKKIFPVSAYTGEGILELLEFLADTEEELKEIRSR
jgi:ethanolamine utilization protein EutP